MIPKTGHSQPRLGLDMGPPQTVTDWLPKIFPDFEGNRGQSLSLRNGPFLLANRGLGLPKLWVKLRAAGGGLGRYRKNGHHQPRLGFGMAYPQTMTDCPRIPRNFREITGSPCVSKTAPFLLANRRWGLPPIFGKIKGLWARAGVMPKMGHSQPRLGLEMGPPQTVIDFP